MDSGRVARLVFPRSAIGRACVHLAVAEHSRDAQLPVDSGRATSILGPGCHASSCCLGGLSKTLPHDAEAGSCLMVATIQMAITCLGRAWRHAVRQPGLVEPICSGGLGSACVRSLCLGGFESGEQARAYWCESLVESVSEDDPPYSKECS